jgi:hypothetical protein
VGPRATVWQKNTNSGDIIQSETNLNKRVTAIVNKNICDINNIA